MYTHIYIVANSLLDRHITSNIEHIRINYYGCVYIYALTYKYTYVYIYIILIYLCLRNRDSNITYLCFTKIPLF